jgi:hypothetical protein
MAKPVPACGCGRPSASFAPNGTKPINPGYFIITAGRPPLFGLFAREFRATLIVRSVRSASTRSNSTMSVPPSKSWPGPSKRFRLQYRPARLGATWNGKFRQ